MSVEDFGASNAPLSKLAVASMLAALLSCIPGVGLIAAVLGIVALYRIGGSGGRQGGKTLAGVGMAIGLIASSMYLAVTLGIRQAYAGYRDNMARPTAVYLKAIESGDLAAACAIFDPGPAPTDDQIRAFGTEVTSRLGAPVGALASWDDFKRMRYFGAVAPERDRGFVMAPLKFEKGIAIFFCRLREGRGQVHKLPENGVDEVVVTVETGETFRLTAPSVEAPK